MLNREWRKEVKEKIRPLGNYLVVEYDEPSDKTEGGILLPDVAKIRPMRALVLAVGPGSFLPNGERVPVPCVPGDIVLVSMSGVEIENPDPDSKKKIQIVTSDDLIAVEG